MVVVFTKEDFGLGLCWITWKLRNAVSEIPRTPASNRLLELPDRQKQQQLKKQQRTPSHSNNVIKDRDGGDQWMISIKEKLNQASQDDVAGTRGKLSIYKVPQHLREVNYDHEAYVPQIVSLGPYHHGKKRLRQMDRHKWRSLHIVLKRTNRDIMVFIKSMKVLEEKARACYEGPIGLSSNEFIEMMVLDGCFVLELFRGADLGFTELGYPLNDPVFAMRGSMHSIQRDMMMLENQLPLFILRRLLGLIGNLGLVGNPKTKGVSELALRFFNPLRPDKPLTELFNPLSDQGLHCLDVFRTSILRLGPSSIKQSSHANRAADKRRQQLIHCVTELREAGIKFKNKETESFGEIKFENGILWIPKLFIHDGTKSLLLNLIAFEQSHLCCSNDITSYVIFMDKLINSPEDVGYLHYCGIIEHWLGSDDEVADLFNRLCREVVFDINDSYLSQLSVDVNKYYNQKWNVWCASLKHNYFNNPWSIISFVAAVVFLLLTSAQTFYGVFGYYRPGSCWAFSTIAAVKGINQIETGKLISISEQELVGCDKSYNVGCNGGLMDYAFEFITKNGGIDNEQDYPYLGVDSTCDPSRKKAKVVSIDGYEDVSPFDEMSLKKAVSHQPVSVSIEASRRAFQLYHKGVFSGECGTALDHGVVSVGYGTENGMDYWLVRNSWGTNWGEDGYIKLQRNVLETYTGKCGITVEASYPVKTSQNPANINQEEEKIMISSA